MSTRRNLFILAALLSACGQPESEQSQLDARWNERNNPELISGRDYESILSELPLTGEVSDKPWSDDYWPTYRGGLSYRWNDSDQKKINYNPLTKADINQLRSSQTARLSPAEKYDLFVGYYDFPTVASERKRTQVLKTIKDSDQYEDGFSIPGWEGLCHGWAPASINFKEPKPISLVGANGIAVEFGSSDIKALLTFYQQYQGNRSTKTYFMADRCYEDFSELSKKLRNNEISQEEFHAARESSGCEDTNAGAFHLVLSNEIGKKQASFLVDVTRDAEVWNQAVNSYRSQILSETTEISEDAAEGTVKEVQVRTEMIYTVESGPSHDPIDTLEATAFYEYILELAENEQIIGGRWISERRPDFLWRETTPEFRGYFAALKHIYEESIK